MTHRCETPGCQSTVTMQVEFENYWGRTVRHWQCAQHMAETGKPGRREELLANMQAGWDAGGPTALTMEQLRDHPAQIALREHQDHCPQCRDVAELIATELREGKVQSQADVDRVGRYSILGCCPQGLDLTKAVGRARLGVEED